MYVLCHCSVRSYARNTYLFAPYCVRRTLLTILRTPLKNSVRSCDCSKNLQMIHLYWTVLIQFRAVQFSFYLLIHNKLTQFYTLRMRGSLSCSFALTSNSVNVRILTLNLNNNPWWEFIFSLFYKMWDVTN